MHRFVANSGNVRSVRVVALRPCRNLHAEALAHPSRAISVRNTLAVVWSRHVCGECKAGVQRNVEIKKVLKLQRGRILGEEQCMYGGRKTTRLLRYPMIDFPEAFSQFTLANKLSPKMKSTSLPGLSDVASRKPASVAVNRMPVKNKRLQRWNDR